jgi:starch phosphorylase
MKYCSFTVLPTTPQKLKPLLEIAYNVWFSWNWDARQLFAKLDPNAWMAANKNPLRMLCDLSQEKLEIAAKNEAYVAEVETVYASFKRYMSGKTWFEDQFGKRDNKSIAYFCCEYGLHESLPIYSGGLGILAGDHLKSASDLGVPLVAVGLLYRQGYFRQGMTTDGQQLEFYPENDWFTMPVHLEKDANDKPIVLSMDVGGDEVWYQIWRVNVGRIPLYLLDTNLPVNQPVHRDITKRLYDSDRDTRIRQEILLGLGGIKALKALGHAPSVFHINEGHSAFLLLGRIEQLMNEQFLTFEEAREVVKATSVFTTHTPVPAGNESFHTSLIKKYFSTYVEKFGLAWPEFMGFGKEKAEENDEKFCLTVLAIKFCNFTNGVSKLHSEVSREMWSSLFPNLPKNEIPIDHITNGVHTNTWLSKTFESLFVRYLQTTHVREISDFTLWKIVPKIPDLDLWNVHMERKRVLVEVIRERLATQLRKRGVASGATSDIENIFDPEALTIGFARRFAPYKRGNLLFRDIERLKKLVSNLDMPVQFIFAGKAHPADVQGKEVLRTVFEISQRTDFSKRIIFMEDYDTDFARFLVQGVDVWLNTPKRPLEASGTSGMKAAMNGVLNLSIPDGWWDEGFNGKNGWSIGTGDNFASSDDVDASILYRLLEEDIAPLYYDRDKMGVPHGWITMMKDSISSCGERFNAHRMLTEYIKMYYLKGEEAFRSFSLDSYKKARDISRWRKRMFQHWDKIEIIEVGQPTLETVFSGSQVKIDAKIKLDGIEAENLRVEVYHGALGTENRMKNAYRERMNKIAEENGISQFQAMIPCHHGGHYGYTIRVLPEYPDLSEKFIPGMIKWGN